MRKDNVRYTIKVATGVPILDAGAYYTGTNVETALQEIGAGTALDDRYVNVTGDTMTGDLIIRTNLDDNPFLYLDEYSSDHDRYGRLYFRKSHSNVLGTILETETDDYLGNMKYMGVNDSNQFAGGAYMSVQQTGASGDYVPTSLEWATYSSTGVNDNQFKMFSDGSVYVGTGFDFGIGTTSWNSGDNIDGGVIANDTITDLSIDWGTGANQVSAVDLPIADAGGYFATDNTEAALQEIGSDYRKKCSKTLVIDPTGCGDYTTIQAALDDNTSGGELFLVYPGTYTDDTITFTANNQTVKGMGVSPAKYHITTANANICDYATYTGCKVSNIKMTVTAATSLVHTVQGSSGSCNFVRCHVSMTTTYATVGAQPCCYNSTGNGTVKIAEGTIEYNHSGTVAAIKSAICWAANTPTYTIWDATIDINGSNASTAITTAYGTGAATISVTRTDADITDTSSGIVAGWYIGGTGDDDFYYNTLHVNGGGTVAIGVYILSTPTIRGMFNHIHVKDSTANYSYWTAGACTLTTQFEDIIAADGMNNTGGATIVHCHSEADGDFDASGTILGGTLTDGTATLTGGAAGTLTFDLSSNTLTGTKAEFDTACSDGTFAYSGGAYHDRFSDFVANEHIDHTGVTLTAGTGLTGGGTIAANRTFNVDVGIADDKIMQVDDADAADNDYAKFTANGLEGRSYSEVLSDLSGQASATFDFNDQHLQKIGTAKLKEQAAAEADTAAYGQLWVKSDTPNTAWFTNDAGTDTMLGKTGDVLPSFSVHKNGTNQTGVAFGTYVKVTWSTERWDTNSDFASSTFTPTVAGKYLLMARTSSGGVGDGEMFIVLIYKNGTLYATGDRINPGATTYCGTIATTIAEANGSTDYFDVYVVHDHASNLILEGGTASSWFCGVRVAD